MRDKRKRITACILACMMAFTITACGKSATDGSVGSEAGGGSSPAGGTAVSAGINKNLVFKETRMELPAFSENGNNSTTAAAVIGDRVYMTGRCYDKDDGKLSLYLLSFDLNGENQEYHFLEEPGNRMVDYSAPVFDENGSVCFFKADYGEQTGEVMKDPKSPVMNEEDITDETSETDPAADGDDLLQQEEAKYYLVKYDNSGNRVFETELNPSDFVEEGEWFGVFNLFWLKEIGVLLQTETGLFLCSPEDGALVRQVYEAEPGIYAEYVLDGKGRIYLAVTEEKRVLKEINPETGKTGDAVELPADTTNKGYDIYGMRPGRDSDFLIVMNDGISTWNVGDTETKPLLGFTDSDIFVDYPEVLLAISDTRLFMEYSAPTTEGTYEKVSSFLDKVDPQNVPDKKVLTIGVIYADNKLRNQVLTFNKSSDKYKIRFIDYAQYNSDADWQAGEARFASDIATGSAPDMMYLNAGQPIQSYAAKGVFEPLDQYLANDPEISKKEYLTSVLDAYKFQGVTYMLTPSFSAYTYAMKKKEADKLTQWDMQTFDLMMQERELDYTITFGYPMDRQTFLQMCMTFDSASFMDWSAGEAKFTSPQFIELLKFVQKIPESVEGWDDADDWRMLDTAFRYDRALVSEAILSSFSDFARLRYATFGEEISFVGFPRTDGAGGAAVSATSMIAMNAHSADKEACWEFMRRFYLDEYQNLVVKESWQLPIARQQLDEMAKKAMQRPYYMEHGEKVEYDETFYLDGKEIVIPPLSQADVDQVYSYLESIDTTVNYDKKVFNIIAEEAAPFFKGQKTAEECAGIIQSKLQLYMDENS